ncbi:hypothetical protein L2E82_26619 [Cichorium intybus]|uniref:Uncharacterized protein n=1 Tax=Cichorium intybus TaxID=13427 RepID=A0ACB9CR15_CICIN|nr:hypothetical protein L2E82_26619 [Cichorium intybus]
MVLCIIYLWPDEKKKKKKSQDLLFPDAVQDLVYRGLHLGLFLFSIVFYFIRLQFAAMDLVFFYSTTWTLDVLLDWFLS